MNFYFCCSQFEDEDEEGDQEGGEIVDTDDEDEESEDEARVLQGTNVDLADGGEGGEGAPKHLASCLCTSAKWYRPAKQYAILSAGCRLMAAVAVVC